MTPDFDEPALRAILRQAWSLETARQWSEENPANGQCNVTAAVIHDIFGGEVRRTQVAGIWHYYNWFDGQRMDLSDSQFTDPGARFAVPDPYADLPSTRDAAMEGIAQREYDVLRVAVLARLGDG